MHRRYLQVHAKSDAAILFHRLKPFYFEDTVNRFLAIYRLVHFLYKRSFFFLIYFIPYFELR